MRKLSKTEFMHRYTNDKYKKRQLEREKRSAIEAHFADVSQRIQKDMRRRMQW